MVYRYLLSNQSTLQCRNCKNKLAELDIEGARQNTCPHCGAIDTCAPAEEVEQLLQAAKRGGE